MARYHHVSFSIDPESVGKELHAAIACLLCNGRELCQRAGQYPCAECVELAGSTELLRVLGRTLLRAARYGREDNTLDSFRAAGHAAEYLFAQAALDPAERDRQPSKTVVSLERIVRRAVDEISQEKLAELQSDLIVLDRRSLPAFRERLVQLILGSEEE